jgi:hypothetical protein
MKKLLFVVLIFALAACSAPTPAQPAPTQQPPIVVTVVVPATSEPAVAAPTEVPPTAVPPTAAPAATEAPAATPTTAPAVVENTPTATLPPAVGADMLVNITRDTDHFSLKCSPSQIVFTATSASPYIVDVVIYYRMVDKLTGMSSQWYAGPTMDKDGKGGFSRTLSALDINPDVRARDNGWLEYQFVALAKDGNVVWRSDKTTYAKQVSYTKECP